MKLIKAGLLAALVSGGLWHAEDAMAYEFYVNCEQGAPNSWKMCEAVTDYPGTKVFQWYGNSGVMLAANCNSGRRFCSTYCSSGAGSGATIFVNVLNSSGQLVGTTSDSIGCIR